MFRLMIVQLVGSVCALTSCTEVLEESKKGKKSTKVTALDSKGPLRLRVNVFRNHMLQVDTVRDKNTVILRDSGQASPGLKGNWIDVAEGGYGPSQ